MIMFIFSLCFSVLGVIHSNLKKKTHSSLHRENLLKLVLILIFFLLRINKLTKDINIVKRIDKEVGNLISILYIHVYSFQNYLKISIEICNSILTIHNISSW